MKEKNMVPANMLLLEGHGGKKKRKQKSVNLSKNGFACIWEGLALVLVKCCTVQYKI